ncbi:hypothetical protein M2D63_017455 [Pseudomonas sp. BJa5]|uniref:hypothetical protein n=1 Tax=Pseudomonas sp. BJa5 TaxID=2936270 RepID=UPI00255A32D3|nr:hypothetical protein [Pseudomonas sp. BGr12]MDL2422906.1 hypothetical protein [Pseudomonas sp. BGr12]
MSNRTLMVAFGLAISVASTTSAYCAYETSQLVLKSYYMGSEAAGPTRITDHAADAAEDSAKG